MSSNDFLNGQMAANFVRGRVSDEWEAYSNKLKEKLQRTELDFVKAECGRIGFAHMFRAVVEELRRVDPNNPLLQKETQLRMIGAKITEKAAELGYVYDMQSDKITGER
ncbi:MAG: hypothetical protein Q7J38_00685 [Gallionella sp.]|nr:hypothetical protein [Gallionella sp.]